MSSKIAEAKSDKAKAITIKAEVELKKAKAKKIKAKASIIKPRTERIKPKAEIKFSKLTLKKELLKEAKVLNVSEDVAKDYVEIVTEKVASWVKKRSKVTQADVDAIIAKEIKKYNKDLAFIYENRGKII